MIPTTEEVRIDATFYDGMGGPITPELFDEWLNTVKAEAWDEGFKLATRNSPSNPHPMLGMNPYRKETV